MKKLLQRAVGRGALAVGLGQGSTRWLGKGFWAVSDQGLFAASNFALNVLLARWLSPQDYGAFAAMFAVFVFTGALYTGLFVEPMLVFGTSRYEGRLPEYLGTLLNAHLGFTALSSLLLLLGSLVLALSGSIALSSASLALALAGPFILFLWLMRRACYIRSEPRLAALGGALYMALMLAGIYALYEFEWLSAASALGLMGLSSLVVSLWLAARLHVKRQPIWGDELTHEAFEDHWRYGRWSMATQATMWVPTNVYYLLLPAWGGLEASATLRALMNLVFPFTNFVQALSVLLLPRLTRARGKARFGALVRSSLTLLTIGAVLYWLFLGLFHSPLVFLLYGGRYGEDAYLLWVLGLMAVGSAVVNILSTALRAVERPDRVFRAFLFAAVVGLTVGLATTYALGSVGAAVGMATYAVVNAGALAYQNVRFAASAGHV